MKRLLSCCLFLAGIFINYNSYSQCTPDPNCTPAQLICPATLPSGCEGNPYAATVTISLGSTIAGATFVDITLNGLTGIPGLTFSCNPSCVFLPNSLNCIDISVPSPAAGTYPIRANLLVDLGFFQLPVDTAIGSITIDTKDCAGVCGGTATIDNCGICSGGTTGILPNCDDGDLCTTDACDGSGGCINTPLACDDFDDCTTDACDNGLCSFTPLSCDDSSVCTNDFCQGGLCQNIPVNCDDGDACTDDICDSLTGGCNNTLIICDDLSVCTGAETCDSLTGCVSGTPLLCDDSDSCTIDGCDALAGCFSNPDPLCSGNPCDSLSPQLAFDYTVVCEGETGTVTNLSTSVDAGATYYLDLGNDGSIDLTVPAADLPADSSFTVGAGTADFTVIVVNSTGCSDTLTLSVTTPEKPELAFDYTPVCEGENTTVVNLSTGVDAGATYYFDVDNDGSVEFTVPASVLPADSTITVSAGTLTLNVIVVNSTGCSDTLLISLSTPEKPELAIDFTSSACEGETVTITNLSTGVDAGAIYYLDVNSNGTINLSVPAADLPTDSSLVLPVPAGTYSYTIYVVNSTGCSDTLVSSITISEKPILAFDYTPVCVGETGTVTNLSTGVDAGATYYLDLGNDGSIDLTVPAADLPADSSFTVGAGTADFTVIVVNSTGCSDTLTLSVTTPEKPELAFDYTPVCEGENTTVVNLSTGVDAGATYYFDVDNDGSVEFTVPASVLPADSTITVSAGTLTLNVIVVNSTGCSDTLLISLSTPEKPELAIDFTSSACEGETVTITNLSTGVDAGAIYYLDVNSNGTINLSVPAADLPTDSSLVLPVPAGTYSYTIYVVNSTGCSDTLVSSISISEKPVLAFDISSACEGENVTIVNLSTGVDAGAIYYLDVNNNGTIDLTLPAAGLPTDSSLVLPAPAGTFDFTVYVVNSTGCSDTLVSTITVLEIPELAFDISSVCEGENVSITNLSTGVDAGAVYSLDVFNDGTIDLTLPASGLPTDSSLVLPAPAGTFDFTVYVVNSTGCSDTLVSSVTVLEKPVLAFDISSACEGENVSITNLSTGVDAGAVYSLDVFNDGTIDLTLPASSLPTDSSLVLPAPAGTFDFTVYVVNSTGCSDTLVSTVTILEKPVLAFNISSACEGENVTITNLSTGVDAGAVYSLDVFNDGTIDLTLPASSLPTDSSLVLPAPAGTFDFTVYVVNSTGCSDTLVSTITVLEKPVLAFDISSACEGENVSITNLSTGVDAGAVYSLDVFNDGTIDLTLPASALPTDSSLVLPAPAGTFDFTVYVVNSTGCSDTLVSTITVLEKPELAFDISSACEGENVTITNLSTGVDAGAVYSLDVFNDGTIDLTLPASSLPTDSSLVLPAPAGTFDFTVYVVNSTGCSDTLVSTITVLEKPELAFDYTPVCAGETGTVTNLSTGVDAGATYYLDLGNDGSIDLSVPAADLPADSSFTVGAGTADFTVIVVNSTGCSDTLTLSVTSPEKPELAFDYQNGCAGDTTYVTNLSTGVDVDAIYYLDLGSDGSIDFTIPAADLPTDSAAVLPISGNIDFTVIVVNSTGCSDTLSASILLLDCNDNDACTDDLCENLACSYTSVDCNDNDACTNDACDAATGCTYSAVDCNDNDACTDDACDTATGCTYSAVDCNDNDACTDDACDAATGCTYSAVDCNDNDACTDDACDTATGCTYSAVDCNDNDACTDDACDAATGCVYTPVICDDSDDCTDDACDPLLGCVFTPVVCDDSDLCTTDKCEFGLCVFVPINCDDGDLCTSDLCVSGSCVFSAINCDDADSCTIDACDPLIGCTYEADTTCDPCAGIDCNDNDPCTIDSCNNGTCENTPVAADVTIENVTPENCQGSVKLKAVSASATSYSWSSGETTAEIDATPGAAYSVTASVGTCEATASYTVPAADELLSSYVLLFAKEVRLNKNTVLSGGVGLTNALGKAKFGNGTDISAASTFVKSKIIQVSSTSTVTTQIPEKATVTPPAFEFNTQCSAGQSLQVPDNSTVTLSGSLYNGITIGKNCTVTFTGSEIDIENLYSKENTTIRFTAPCVKLRICKKLQLGANNIFNPDASELVAFVELDVTIEGGSTVIADIHMLGGKMTVNSGTQSDPNSLTGLFTGNFLEAGDFTTWQQNTTCNPACQPNPPAECDPSERRVYSFTLVDAASDLDIGPLNDGDIIDLALTGPISVRANVCNDGLVESVKFFLDGSFFKVENIAFYTIAGDNNGNYNPWNVTPGTYTITATPYSGDNGSGTPGTSYTVTITIINSALKMDDSAVVGTPVNELSLNAFPNPFSDKLNIEFTLAEDSRATLELFNVSGQKLATLFDGFVKASVTQKTEFTPGSFTNGMIIYRLTTQQGTFFDKVLMVK